MKFFQCVMALLVVQGLGVGSLSAKPQSPIVVELSTLSQTSSTVRFQAKIWSKIDIPVLQVTLFLPPQVNLLKGDSSLRIVLEKNTPQVLYYEIKTAIHDVKITIKAAAHLGISHLFSGRGTLHVTLPNTASATGVAVGQQKGSQNRGPELKEAWRNGRRLRVYSEQ